jgi:hypothetical protein
MLFDPFVVFSRKTHLFIVFVSAVFFFASQNVFKNSQKTTRMSRKGELKKHLGEHNLWFYSIFYRLRVDHKLRTLFCGGFCGRVEFNDANGGFGGFGIEAREFVKR